MPRQELCRQSEKTAKEKPAILRSEATKNLMQIPRHARNDRLLPHLYSIFVRYFAQKGLIFPLSYTCRLQRCSRSTFRFSAS